MPAGATTSTDASTPPQREPIGYLSAVFPGSGAQTADPRTRVCEQTWLEYELFERQSHETLIATIEENYQSARTTENHSVPGCMGEQLLFRQMALTHISPGLRLLMADCIIRIEQVQQVRLHKFAPESFPLIHLSIIEPGLVEPGAPLLIL